MLTMKRIYLYGVLGASLVPLLMGLTELLRLLIRAVADGMRSGALGGAQFVREDLSWALALVVVALPIWAVHLWLVRRSMSLSPTVAADERASAARATYFFLVLAVSGIVSFVYLFDLSSHLVRLAIDDQPEWGLAGALAGSIVVGSAWLLHLRWRGTDLRLAPTRTAGDWLTRAYLYGALFAVAAVGLVSAALVLATAAREVIDVQPAWGDPGWWRSAIVGPLAGVSVASLAWAIHWFAASRLLRAAPPMGPAHRDARTRTGYFLTVVLLCAVATLVLVSMSLRHLFAEMLGVWRPTDGSRFIEDLGGTLVMVVPFLAAWWWHIRRASREALAFGDPARGRSTMRAGRLVVAFVGLAGLAIGATWEVQALLDAVGSTSRSGLLWSSMLRDSGTPAFALALVGLALWAPAWVLTQRDRARDRLEVAISTGRRAYLLLVSGIAVVAGMGSLALLVFGVTRVLLDAGRIDNASWAISVLTVAATVLLYHLLQLRADNAVAHLAPTLQPAPDAPSPAGAGLVFEQLEISAPAGADFKVLNAAIRTELPDGYSIRVVSPDSSAAAPGTAAAHEG